MYNDKKDFDRFLGSEQLKTEMPFTGTLLFYSFQLSTILFAYAIIASPVG